jgi:hypothetical protein
MRIGAKVIDRMLQIDGQVTSDCTDKSGDLSILLISDIDNAKKLQPSAAPEL